MIVSISASCGQNHPQSAPPSVVALEDHFAWLGVVLALSEVLAQLQIPPCTAAHLQTQSLRRRNYHHLRPMKKS
jgi:hypothetical protein